MYSIGHGAGEYGVERRPGLAEQRRLDSASDSPDWHDVRIDGLHPLLREAQLRFSFACLDEIEGSPRT
jgi:hypothetical protein